MSTLKSGLKNIFRITRTLFILDKINFGLDYIRHYKMNRGFKKANLKFKLPPDYFLHETFRLDYKGYKESGEIAAKEILEFTSKYLPERITILEWGCGVSRVIRHIRSNTGLESTCFGCDINKEMIDWSKRNVEGVEFQHINYAPPTSYPNNTFDLVFALSVFTHIEKDQQPFWIDEISRIVKPKGIFLFTTHGSKYFTKLTNSALRHLTMNGSYTLPYHKKGHRMMSTYNTYETFRKLIEEKFQILEYYDGMQYPSKAGGQDLWIAQQK